jgi:hypothetical protein
MTIKTTKFGPGLMTVGTVPTDFSCEVLGGTVNHEYEDVSDSRTTLCGDVIAGAVNRLDGVTFQLVNDLTTAGLYAYLQTNDLAEQAIVFTPNTDGAASWAGTVQLRLPDSIGADEFNADIESEVTWPGVGKLTFTPGTVAATAAAGKKGD